MPTVRDIADALAGALDRERYAREGDPAGVWLDSDREVRRLALRLEPGRAPYGWAENVDAVVLHRPFGVWPARLPARFGVLAVHRALDDRLSVGTDPALVAALGWELEPEPLRRGGAEIGLIGRRRQTLADAVGAVERVLGGIEDAIGPEPESVEAVALVGAMTDALVDAAAERGAGLYVTGQIRKPARQAVERCGVRAVAVGQDRAEAWGLRRLGALVREAFPDVETVEQDLPPVKAPDA